MMESMRSRCVRSNEGMRTPSSIATFHPAAPHAWEMMMTSDDVITMFPTRVRIDGRIYTFTLLGIDLFIHPCIDSFNNNNYTEIRKYLTNNNNPIRRRRRLTYCGGCGSSSKRRRRSVSWSCTRQCSPAYGEYQNQIWKPLCLIWSNVALVKG